MLIPRGALPERSCKALVERAKVWAVSRRPLKGRATPAGNRARSRRACSLDLSGGDRVQGGNALGEPGRTIFTYGIGIGNVSWV
jgi:hypothetical protein